MAASTLSVAHSRTVVPFLVQSGAKYTGPCLLHTSTVTLHLVKVLERSRCLHTWLWI